MRWFVAAILLTFAALILHLNLLAYTVLLVSGVYYLTRFVTARWLTMPVANRSVSLEVAEVADSVDVSISITNRGRIPILWMLLEDLLSPSAIAGARPALEVTGKRVGVTRLNSGESLQWDYQFVCRRRGYYQIGPLVMETGDIFGLHRRFRVLSEPKFVLVFPQVIPLLGYDVQSKRPIGEVVMTHRLFEDPTRISGVRQYQPGDPLSRVHWRATARTGILQSKVFEPTSLAGATFVLDFHVDSYGTGDEPIRSELGVTAIASVSNLLFEMGQQIGLLSNGRDAIDRIQQEGWQGDTRTRDEARANMEMRTTSQRLRPVLMRTSKSPERMIEMLRTLARLEKTNGLTMRELLADFANELSRDATIIAVIGRVTIELAASLGSLRRQGFAVTAIINSYSDEHFANASGPLLNQGIETRHLKDESSIHNICMRQALVGR